MNQSRPNPQSTDPAANPHDQTRAALPPTPLPADPPRDTTIPPANDPRNRSPRIGWTLLIAIILAFTLFRLAWLHSFSGLELAADEAQYWDWSRRLDLSYATKGPGIAWLIAASTALLGTSEFAIRAPAVVAHTLTILAIALLAAAGINREPRDRARAACYAGIAALLIPAFQATGFLMTIDMPYILCWAIAALAAWLAWTRAAAGRRCYHHAIILGLALGIGFLFKYTILLIIPGIAAFWWLRRASLPRHARWQRRRALALTTLIASACAMPILIWNGTHGFPTVRHLLGHAGLPGGDKPSDLTPATEHAPLLERLTSAIAAAADRYDLLWTLEYLAAQIGIVGPLIILMALAIAHIGRHPRLERPQEPALSRTTRPFRRVDADAFLVWCALPIWSFYLLLTFLTPAQGNWPIAAYTTLAALVGRVASTEFPRLRARIRTWESHFPPRPKQGWLRRRPESPFQIAWHWSIGYGLVALLAMTFITQTASLPIIARFIPIHRLTGARDLAQQVHAIRQRLAEQTSSTPLIAAARYQHAALLAFYLPDRPSVRSAASLLGDRKSSYDYFPDTRWDAIPPHDIDRPIILFGASAERWNDILILSDSTTHTILEPRRDEPRPHAVLTAERFIAVRTRPPITEQTSEPPRHADQRP
ncbi:MAG: glycosyltransferase family 39 protein [Phycisphaerales bacterium]